MNILDIGCGVMPEHGATQESIGIDINFEHGKVYVDTPIIADAHNLPIRDKVIDSFIACAILEHLDRPDKCLKEIDRVIRENSYGLLNIPMNADTRKEVFKRFIKEFPFATIYTLKKMRKWNKYFKIDGLMHKNLMTLKFVEKYFEIDTKGIIENKRLHHWFLRATPINALVKLGIIKNKIWVKEMGEYEFCVIKRSDKIG